MKSLYFLYALNTCIHTHTYTRSNTFFFYFIFEVWAHYASLTTLKIHYVDQVYLPRTQKDPPFSTS